MAVRPQPVKLVALIKLLAAAPQHRQRPRPMDTGYWRCYPCSAKNHPAVRRPCHGEAIRQLKHG